MTKRVERFRSRRARLDSRVGDLPPPIADADLVQGILSQEIDWSLIDSVALKVPAFNDVVVTDEEVTRCLSDLDSAFTRQKYDALFEGVKDTLIDQLLSPLNLSRSNLDDKFMDEMKYKKSDYDHNGIREKFIKERMNPDGTITDEYTGKHGDLSKMDLDHVISKKDLHEQFDGHLLYPKERKELAKDSDNLVFTDRSINRKKGARQLEGQDLDRRRTRHIENKAKESVENKMPKGLNRIRRAADIYGINAGIEQGKQQALALLVSELISAVFAEAKDVFANGWKGGDYNAGWLESLRKRLKRIGRHLLNRWKDVAAAFGSGWLSGFLSATISALLRMFGRTWKNMRRIIREGFLSIMKSINVLLFPPEGMSLSQAAHEATKVFATGLVVTGGILVGEHIANSLPMFGDVLGPVLGGLISGLGSLFVVFMLDKFDRFGVNFDERHAFIMDTLEGRISEITRKIEDMAAESERITFAS